MAKPRNKAAAPKAKRSPSNAAPAETAVKLIGNPEKLMQHLQGVLKSDEFTEISQTAVAQETGIPLGSMTAAIKKLTELGRIEVNPESSLKLLAAQPMQPASPTPQDA